MVCLCDGCVSYVLVSNRCLCVSCLNPVFSLPLCVCGGVCQKSIASNSCGCVPLFVCGCVCQRSSIGGDDGQLAASLCILYMQVRTGRLMCYVEYGCEDICEDMYMYIYIYVYIYVYIVYTCVYLRSLHVPPSASSTCRCVHLDWIHLSIYSYIYIYIYNWWCIHANLRLTNLSSALCDILILSVRSSCLCSMRWCGRASMGGTSHTVCLPLSLPALVHFFRVFYLDISIIAWCWLWLWMWSLWIQEGGDDDEQECGTAPLASRQALRTTPGQRYGAKQLNIYIYTFIYIYI
jgi:hypothetical protein